VEGAATDEMLFKKIIPRIAYRKFYAKPPETFCPQINALARNAVG
jgi:hypothetical protein